MNTAALAWFKSSYSGSEGGDCIELACTWRKSTHSSNEGGDCVEVAAHPAAVHIRDSKAAPSGPVLTLSPATWSEFLDGLAR